MDITEAEELHNALRYKTDSRFVQRVCAVNMRKVQELSVEETAANMMKSQGWVSKWTARYEEGGLDALYDLPRSGRPAFVDREDMNKFMSDIREKERTEPRSVQQSIRKLFDVQGLCPSGIYSSKTSGIQQIPSICP